MKWRTITMVGVVLILMQPAWAAEDDGLIDGHFYLAKCGERYTNPTEHANWAAWCLGFTWGMFLGLLPTLDGYMCPHSRIQADQMEDIVLAYLHKRPELRGEPITRLASWAFSEAFPCGEGER
jgi:Rap1a immunity proteins